jgi:hypothetical protein
MRTCAKMRCEQEPVTTVALAYADRAVVVRSLLERPDPNLLDLCREHAARLSPPVGWTIRDERDVAALTA